jgi:uncharacterized protein (DUF2147 family)
VIGGHVRDANAAMSVQPASEARPARLRSVTAARSMNRWLMIAIAAASTLAALVTGLVAETPLGIWKTVDEKTGKARSEVEIYEQGGKLYGKILSIPEPNDKDGKPKICLKCPGADKDRPIIGLVIIKDLAASGDRYTGGTIMDPEDGKVYRAEIWIEGGTLKVRGYIGPFYRTQTWPRAG